MKDMGKQTEHLKLKVLRALGMAQRAGRLASGEFMTEREIQSFRATLVIVAEKQSARSSGLRLRSVTRDSQRRF